MASSNPILSSTTPPPWQQKQLSYGLKLLIMFSAALLFVVALISGITWIAIVPQSIVNGPGPRDTIGSMLVGGLTLTGVFAVSLFGLIKLFPLVSTPTSFKPSYGVVAADVAGHPFDVRYRRGGWGRSLSSKGTILFAPDGLLVKGYLTPSPLFQLCIVVVVTLIPIILFGVGLGLLPALIIAYYAGRKKITQSIPYIAVRDLTVKGCKATFKNPSAQPRSVEFYVTGSDGERLYRELQVRFPAAMIGGLG
jgi:hypothetical protein